MGVYWSVVNLTKKQILDPLGGTDPRWMDGDKKSSVFAPEGSQLGTVLLAVLAPQLFAEHDIPDWQGDRLLVVSDHYDAHDFEDITQRVFDAVCSDPEYDVEEWIKVRQKAIHEAWGAFWDQRAQNTKTAPESTRS